MGRSINLSPRPVLDADGNVLIPGLDNHSMGTIFEELIRRFNEDNNEEAGEHFTPRDVVDLMGATRFRSCRRSDRIRHLSCLRWCVWHRWDVDRR